MNMFTFILFCIGILLRKSVDTAQTPHNAASEQGRHCLHISRKRVPSLKRVKLYVFLPFLQNKNNFVNSLLLPITLQPFQPGAYF